jgi:hypothetical protein
MFFGYANPIKAVCTLGHPRGQIPLSPHVHIHIVGRTNNHHGGGSIMARQKLSPQGQRLRTIILTVPIIAATSGLQNRLLLSRRKLAHALTLSGALQTPRARRTPAQAPSSRRGRRRPEDSRVSPRRLLK